MSKEQKDKIPRDASWPEWYDGKTISETGFCQDFLEIHLMKCINGRVFSVTCTNVIFQASAKSATSSQF